MSDDDDEACIHGMDPSWCSTCLHGPQTVEPAEPIWTFTARYDGRCGSCNLPITAGQRVTRWSDECYRHDGCKP